MIDFLRFSLSMFRPKRILIMAALAVLAFPVTLLLRSERGWTIEQSADLATIAYVAVMFLAIACVTVLLTETWTPVGRALTAISIILFVLYAGAVLGRFYPALWPFWFRWAMRITLIWTCVCVIDGLWAYVSDLRARKGIDVIHRRRKTDWPNTEGEA